MQLSKRDIISKLFCFNSDKSLVDRQFFGRTVFNSSKHLTIYESILDATPYEVVFLKLYINKNNEFPLTKVLL